MAIVTTDSKHYTNIANAIREKIGTTETFTPAQMADGIGGVYTAGYANGYSEGEAGGVEIGRELGKQAEYDRFWDEYQKNGKRTNYYYAFAGSGWNAKTYVPKYPIILDGSIGTFYQSEIADTLVSITLRGKAQQLFGVAYSLTTIRELKFDGVTQITNLFNLSSNITNINFTGTLSVNGLNLQWATKLTKDSILSLFNILDDFSEDTSGTAHTVTIGTDNLAKLTDAEKAIATQKGWTLA